MIIPAWQRAASIRAAIDSVLRQTWTEFELIVVDDGSSDGTAEIAEAVEDPRVRVVRHAANAGAGAARNTGVRAAKGDWVAFQDSDDEWLPDKLSRQIARRDAGLADGRAPIAVYCAMAVVRRPPAGGRMTLDCIPWPDARRLEGDVADALLDGNFVSTQTLFARRDALIEAGLFDETLPALEDWDLALRLSRLGPFAFIDEPLVIQRFSDNSLTRSGAKRLAGYARILEKNAETLAADPVRLARHARRIALGHARLGDRGAALRWTRRSLAARPLPSGWAPLIRALVAGAAPRPGKTP